MTEEAFGKYSKMRSCLLYIKAINFGLLISILSGIAKTSPAQVVPLPMLCGR